MRKALVIVLLGILFGGLGLVGYSKLTGRPGWVSSLFSRSEDAEASARVRTALNLSRRLSAFDMTVEASGGIVTLGGRLPSENLKSLAGEIAADTEGVREVNNQIVVDAGAQPSIESVRIEDLEIRAAILEAYGRSPELGGRGIDVRVENRVVTLGGSVETTVQKNGAEQAASAIPGVASVVNELTVTSPDAPTEPPAPTARRDPDGELAERVEFELYRTDAFDTRTMTVGARGGVVTIGGTVRSVAEKLLAEKIAQAVPGVSGVNNELRVAASPGGQ